MDTKIRSFSLSQPNFHTTHKKKVCVVGKAQFLITNSVVVTFVQVIQSETTWPANKDRTNRFVQILANLLPTLLKNAEGDE